MPWGQLFSSAATADGAIVMGGLGPDVSHR